MAPSLSQNGVLKYESIRERIHLSIGYSSKNPRSYFAARGYAASRNGTKSTLLNIPPEVKRDKAAGSAYLAAFRLRKPYPNKPMPPAASKTIVEGSGTTLIVPVE